MLQPQSCNTINPQTNNHRKHHTIHRLRRNNPHCPCSHVSKENQMKTQKELLTILNRTSAYFYSTNQTLVFHLDPNFDQVIGSITWDANDTYTFKMNPNTHVIFGFKTNKAGITTSIFTPTFKLGDRRIAPDMIRAIHTLLTKNPASDAYFHVSGNRVTRQTVERHNSASDATAANHPSSIVTIKHRVSTNTSSRQVSTEPFVLRFPDSVSQVSTQSQSLLSRLFARLFRSL